MSSSIPQVIDTITLNNAEIVYLLALLGLPGPAALASALPQPLDSQQQQLLLEAGQASLAQGPYASDHGSEMLISKEALHVLRTSAAPEYSLWLMIDRPGDGVTKWYIHGRGEIAVAYQHPSAQLNSVNFLLLGDRSDVQPFTEQLMGLTHQPAAEGDTILVQGQAFIQATEEARAGQREKAYGTLLIAGADEQEAQCLLNIITHAQQTVGFVLVDYRAEEDLTPYEFTIADIGSGMWLFTPHPNKKQMIAQPASAAEIRAQLEQHVAQVQGAR